MSYPIRLDLPDDIAVRVQGVATRSQRELEEVLLEWQGHAARNVAVNQLSDAEVLALCDGEFSADDQRALHELYFFSALENCPVDMYSGTRDRSLLQKVQALQVAAHRGLHRSHR